MDTAVLHTGSWIIYMLRSIKRFSAYRNMLNTGADVCSGGIEQVERLVPEELLRSIAKSEIWERKVYVKKGLCIPS